MDDEKRDNEIWYCNYFKIIVTNGDVKLIDKNKIQKLLLKLGFAVLTILAIFVHLWEIKNKEKV